jgi:predicted nucleic acid-binding protein
VRFWDTSALIPLVAADRATRKMLDLLSRDREIVVWMFTPIDLAATIRRKGPRYRPEVRREAEAFLAALEPAFITIDDGRAVEERARKLAASHALSAADAQQLAAALVACFGKPDGFPFVTLNQRLAGAARAEGFAVLP